MAADERRHNKEHVSYFICVPDLIRQVRSKITYGSLNHEATVLLSTVHKNSHHKGFKLYRKEFLYVWQSKLGSLDPFTLNDFLVCVLRYIKNYSVRYRNDIKFVWLDDESKLDIGEPSMTISSGIWDNDVSLVLKDFFHESTLLKHDIELQINPQQDDI